MGLIVATVMGYALAPRLHDLVRIASSLSFAAFVWVWMKANKKKGTNGFKPRDSNISD